MKSIPFFNYQLYEEAKTVIKLGFPIVLGQLAQMSMGFVDTIMAGNLSPEDLAAVAIGTSFINPIFVFSIGLMMALNPIIAQLVGAGNHNDVSRYVRHSFYIAIIVSIISFFAVRNLYWVMTLLGIEKQVADLAQGYVEAMSWGFMPIIMYLSLRFFNEGMSNTKPTMWFALLGLVVNIIGNYVLMFGKFGFPRLGAVGTGWASTLVAFAMFFGMLVYSILKKEYKHLELFTSIKKPELSILKDIAKVGIPNGLSAFLEVSMFAIVALLMGKLGTDIVAAHQIAINIGALIFMIPLGISNAISVRVGLFYGKKDKLNVLRAASAGILTCLGITTITAIILLSFPTYLVSIYTTDITVTQIAVSLLLMAGIFQLSDGLQVSAAGALRGLKDTTIPMIVNFISYWIIGIPSGYLIGIYLGVGPVGLWIGLIAGLTVAAILHSTRFSYLFKRISF